MVNQFPRWGGKWNSSQQEHVKEAKAMRKMEAVKEEPWA
jgi:hypothetical protein